MKLYLAVELEEGVIDTLHVELEQAPNKSMIATRVEVENDLNKAFYLDANDYEDEDDFKSDCDYMMSIVNQRTYGIRKLIWQEY